MPAGSRPVSLQVTVPRMPVAVKVWLKTASTVPVLTPGFVTVMVWQLIVSVYVAPVPVQPFWSVAGTVIGNEPTVFVVPERTPLDVLSEMPAGSAPVLDQVIV